MSYLDIVHRSSQNLSPKKVSNITQVFPSMMSDVFLPEPTSIPDVDQIPIGPYTRTAATPPTPIHKPTIHTDLKPLKYPHLHSLPHIMQRTHNESDGNSTGSASIISLPPLPALSSLFPIPLQSNVFKSPIDTIAPIPAIPTVTTHPVPRLGVQQVSPINTNKFYANFFLGDQFAGTWTRK